MSAGARRPAPESGLPQPYRDGRHPLRVPRRLTRDSRRVDASRSHGADRALVWPRPLAGHLTHGSASGTDTRCHRRSGRSAQHAAARIGRHIDAWTQHAGISDHAIVCRARIHDASILGSDVPDTRVARVRIRIVCVRGDL